MLTEEQYSLLRPHSEERGKSVSVLIRVAVEQVYVQGVNRQRREAAVERLLAPEAPLADWGQMEKDIARGALDGCDPTIIAGCECSHVRCR